MSNKNFGTCQCKGVRYEIVEHPTDCLFCHCSICRRLTGSAVGAYGSVLSENFKWLAGEELISTYAQNSSCYRSFCSVCGSNILSKHKLAPDHVYLSLGCLELSDQTEVKIEYQQFVGSKADWAPVEPSIEQHHGWPEWISTKITKLRRQKSTSSSP